MGHGGPGERGHPLRYGEGLGPAIRLPHPLYPKTNPTNLNPPSLYAAPEVRAQVPNQSPVLPYVAMTFDVNFWNFRETEIACNFWYCTQVDVFRFTPGFTAKLGLGFRIKRGAHIDVGAKYSYSGPGKFFVTKEQWITGYLGFLIR